MTTYSEAVEQTITAGEQIHQIVNGTATTEVTVEDGSKVPSIRKALLDNFYFKDPIAWQVGQTENVFNQLRQFTDGSWWYTPSATASNPISMGSTPVGDPLWKIYDFDAIGKLTPQIREALRRSYAEAGYNLVSGSFEAGGTMANANDVLLQERTGKVFSGPAGVVVAGTNPASGGFVDRSGDLLRSQFLKRNGDIRGWGAKCDGVTVDDIAIAAAIADTGGIITIPGPTLVSATVLVEGADRPNVIFTGNGQLLAQKSSFTFHPGTRGILVFKECSNPIAYMPNIRGCRLDLPTAPEPWEDGDAGIEYLLCTGVCRTIHPDLDGFKTWGIIHVQCEDYTVIAPRIRNCLVQSGIGGTNINQAIVTNPDIRWVGLYGLELETVGTNKRSKVSGGLISKALKAVSCVNNTLNPSITGVTAEECLTGFNSTNTVGATFQACNAVNTRYGFELVNVNKSSVTGNSYRKDVVSLHARVRSYDFLTKVVAGTGYTLNHPVPANLTVGLSIELEDGSVRTIASVGTPETDPVLGEVVPFTTTPALELSNSRMAFCRQLDMASGTAFAVMYGGAFNRITGNDIGSVYYALLSFGDHYDLNWSNNSYENVTEIFHQGSAGNLINSSLKVSPGECSGSASTVVSNFSKFSIAYSHTITQSFGSVAGLPVHRVALGSGRVGKITCVLNDDVAASGGIVLKVNGVDQVTSFTGSPRTGVVVSDIQVSGSISIQLVDTVGDISGSGYSVNLCCGLIK
ncbi:MAG: hypothetical protein ACRC6V_19665 [Bacteroidales bacterium]